ncbi:unnamed protein product [Anisakis simplex]|uniref:Nuclear hormone receptor,putative (inferred by orthology to a S. mansoni protein) n=1 Tax=Anisakis simplex TaxID=6269 RepID=A0A0M3K5J8_ANISI|nr:unnamed protein product [Anisakis simplex]
MEKDGTTSTCGVCGDVSDGQHFGAVACRACAAFFRRSTVTERKYTCRFDGDCPIGKGQPLFLIPPYHIKLMLKPQMSKVEGVQRNRDGLGTRSERKPTLVQAITASLSVDAFSLNSEISPPSTNCSQSSNNIIVPTSSIQTFSPQDQPIALPTPVITQMPDESQQQVCLLYCCCYHYQ